MTDLSLTFGIDPGKSGAIAALDSDGKVISVCKLDGTLRDVLDWFGELVYTNAFAYLERAQAMPKQGVSSAFNYGRCFGWLEALLAALKIPYEYVASAKWQLAMRCRTKGNKNISKAKAQQLFPSQKITHAVADSLLIAEFGRRMRHGIYTNAKVLAASEEEPPEGDPGRYIYQPGQAEPKDLYKMLIIETLNSTTERPHVEAAIETTEEK